MNIFRSLILWLAVIALFAALPANSQTVDTLTILSPSMNRELKNVVILPESYAHHPERRYPVVYLLHGHGNHYYSWINKIAPQLPERASETDMIFVCPEGETSWYWDSPVNPGNQFETYVSKELTGYIDSCYRTIRSRNGRAITGYSMGGHGGLWLGFRHPDIFGACGSMSGGVDIRPFPENWNMKNQLGTYAENKQRWDEHTVINQIPYNMEYGPLAIIIDCGTEDFFYTVNQQLHEKLMQLKIPHDYITRPGIHTHTYWQNAIDYQILFFRKSFGSQQ